MGFFQVMRKIAYGGYGESSSTSGHGSNLGPQAQAMIQDGMNKDRRYGYRYGDYYEKKARKKAVKTYGGQ